MRDRRAPRPFLDSIPDRTPELGVRDRMDALQGAQDLGALIERNKKITCNSKVTLHSPWIEGVSQILELKQSTLKKQTS